MSRPKSRARKSNQPVKAGLKGFAAARKSSVDLMSDIQKHVVAEGIKNQGVGRESHKIHVSEVVKDSCPRMLYYKVTKQKTSDLPAAPYHRLEMIWATGHQEHAKYQRWLAEMGDLWGTWHCRRCDGRFIGLAQKHCELCGYGGFLEYDEVELVHDLYHLVGHADGAVPRLDSLVEVKSFSIGTVRIENPEIVKEHTHKVDGKTIVDIEGVWASIKRPLKSHLHQGLMYLWICKQMGLPYDKIIFIYENKTTQATKSFVVKLTERLVQPFIDTLEEVAVFAAEGVVPARPPLYVKEAKPCNTCVFRTHCWDEEERDDDRAQSTPVRAGRQSPRSEAEGGAAEVRSARPTRGRYSEGARRHHRTGRPGTDQVDDRTDRMGVSPGGSTGDGGGGREVGGGSDGQGTRSGFSRQRQGRNRAQG